jgi:hypothetical protein
LERLQGPHDQAQQQPIHAHPPPPYQTSARGTGGEDPFAGLRGYDTVFIVDDSESMELHWEATMTSLEGVVEKAGTPGRPASCWCCN